MPNRKGLALLSNDPINIYELSWGRGVRVGMQSSTLRHKLFDLHQNLLPALSDFIKQIALAILKATCPQNPY